MSLSSPILVVGRQQETELDTKKLLEKVTWKKIMWWRGRTKRKMLQLAKGKQQIINKEIKESEKRIENEWKCVREKRRKCLSWQWGWGWGVAAVAADVASAAVGAISTTLRKGAYAGAEEGREWGGVCIKRSSNSRNRPVESNNKFQFVSSSSSSSSSNSTGATRVSLCCAIVVVNKNYYYNNNK